MNNGKDLPQRKHVRLKNYDYSQNGAYFVTICTKERKPLLSSIPVGRGALTPPEIHLSQIGEISERYILSMSTAYACVHVDHYVIMPNHIHLLLRIDSAPASNGGMRASRPTLQTIVRSFKTLVTRQLGTSIWQDSFYEHIVRSEASYLEIWKYIDENPIKWQEDKYYAP